MQNKNVMKGRESKDAEIGGLPVAFINHNVSEYPIAVGAPNFTPVVVEKEKDISLNIAKQHAKQEYDRIMEMVRILEDQAKALVSRLDATDLIHNAVYGFHPVYGKQYHVYFDETKEKNILSLNHPDNWCAGPPSHWKFVASVFKKGDSTWEYVDEDSTDN